MANQVGSYSLYISLIASIYLIFQTYKLTKVPSKDLDSKIFSVLSVQSIMVLTRINGRLVKGKSVSGIFAKEIGRPLHRIKDKNLLMVDVQKMLLKNPKLFLQF